jgi:phospho-N-acetylmuramoyl-pentapeptide-transferase
MGTIGFIDDYIKKFKKDKEGLKGRFKVLGQIGLGIIVGATFFFTRCYDKRETSNQSTKRVIGENANISATKLFAEEEKSTKTTIPFVKGNEFDYSLLLLGFIQSLEKYAWIIFILLSIFIICSLKWRQFNRWYRRIGSRNICYYCTNPWNFCLGFG